MNNKLPCPSRHAPIYSVFTSKSSWGMMGKKVEFRVLSRIAYNIYVKLVRLSAFHPSPRLTMLYKA